MPFGRGSSGSHRSCPCSRPTPLFHGTTYLFVQMHPTQDMVCVCVSDKELGSEATASLGRQSERWRYWVEGRVNARSSALSPSVEGNIANDASCPASSSVPGTVPSRRMRSGAKSYEVPPTLLKSGWHGVIQGKWKYAKKHSKDRRQSSDDGTPT